MTEPREAGIQHEFTPTSTPEDMDIHWEEAHATITHCISARRHLGDGHYGHANFGARLLARLGLGTGGLALGLTIAALARPAYAYYPAYSYGYGYPAYGYNYGGYYAPSYSSAYYYGGSRQLSMAAIAPTTAAVIARRLWRLSRGASGGDPSSTLALMNSLIGGRQGGRAPRDRVDLRRRPRLQVGWRDWV